MIGRAKYKLLTQNFINGRNGSFSNYLKVSITAIQTKLKVSRCLLIFSKKKEIRSTRFQTQITNYYIQRQTRNLQRLRRSPESFGQTFSQPKTGIISAKTYNRRS